LPEEEDGYKIFKDAKEKINFIYIIIIITIT